MKNNNSQTINQDNKKTREMLIKITLGGVVGGTIGGLFGLGMGVGLAVLAEPVYLSCKGALGVLREMGQALTEQGGIFGKGRTERPEQSVFGVKSSFATAVGLLAGINISALSEEKKATPKVISRKNGLSELVALSSDVEDVELDDDVFESELRMP